MAETFGDDMMNVESRPDVDHSNQITGVEHTLAKKGLGEKELVEDKVSGSWFTPSFKISIIFFIQNGYINVVY